MAAACARLEWRRALQVKGRTLRQPLPSAHPRSDLRTLMRLMTVAMEAGPELKRFAYEATDGIEGCVVMLPTKPTKGLKRAMQKVQEEYGGDYTRLLDYCRLTILCDSLESLEKVRATRSPCPRASRVHVSSRIRPRGRCWRTSSQKSARRDSSRSERRTGSRARGMRSSPAVIATCSSTEGAGREK